MNDSEKCIETYEVPTSVGTYEYTLNNFNLQSYDKNDCIESDVFELCDNKWMIKFYPKNSGTDYTNNVGIYVYNKGIMPIKFKYTVKLNTYVHESIKIHKILPSKNIGFPKICNSDDIQYFTTINISIDITVYKNTKPTLTNHFHNLQRPLTTTNQFAQLMYTNNLFFDLIVRVKNHDIKCHRCVLAGVSPVFDRMLHSGMVECESGIITIDDFEHNVMEEVIRFIYLNNFSSDVALHNIIFELFEAGLKYQIVQLVLECCDTLIEVVKKCTKDECENISLFLHTKESVLNSSMYLLVCSNSVKQLNDFCKFAQNK